MAALGKTLGKMGGIDLARIGPIVLIIPTGADGAGDQIQLPIALQQIKAMHMGQFSHGSNFPVAGLFGGLYQDDLSLFGIVGRIHLMGSQELSVRSGNPGHGHGPAGLGPNFFQNVSMGIQQQTGEVLFRSNQVMTASLIREGKEAVAFGKIGNEFFFDLQCNHPHMKKLCSL